LDGALAAALAMISNPPSLVTMDVNVDMTDERTDENNSAAKLQPASLEKTHNFRKKLLVRLRPICSVLRRKSTCFHRRQSLGRQHLSRRRIGDRDFDLSDSERNLSAQPQVHSIAQRMIGVLGLEVCVRGGSLFGGGGEGRNGSGAKARRFGWMCRFKSRSATCRSCAVGEVKT